MRTHKQSYEDTYILVAPVCFFLAVSLVSKRVCLQVPLSQPVSSLALFCNGFQYERPQYLLAFSNTNIELFHAALFRASERTQVLNGDKSCLPFSRYSLIYLFLRFATRYVLPTVIFIFLALSCFLTSLLAQKHTGTYKHARSHAINA